MKKLTLVKDMRVGDSFVVGVVAPVVYKIEKIIYPDYVTIIFLLSSEDNHIIGYQDYPPDYTLFKLTNY